MAKRKQPITIAKVFGGAGQRPDLNEVIQPLYKMPAADMMLDQVAAYTAQEAVGLTADPQTLIDVTGQQKYLLGCAMLALMHPHFRSLLYAAMADVLNMVEANLPGLDSWAATDDCLYAPGTPRRSV